MDTSLKSPNGWAKFSYHWSVKLAAFLLAVLSFGACFFIFLYAAAKTDNEGALFHENYLSGYGTGEIYTVYYNIVNAFELKSEEYIKSDEYWDKIKDAYYSDSPESRENTIRQRIYELRNIKDVLKSTNGIYYYAVLEDTVLTNCALSTREEFILLENYYILDRAGYETSFSNIGYDTGRIESDDVIIYIAFDSNYLMQKQLKFESDKEFLNIVVIIVISLAVLFLLMLSYLIAAAGRKADKSLKLAFIDRLFSELTIGIVFILICMVAVVMSDGIGSFNGNDIILVLLAAGIPALVCTVTLTFVLSIVRKLKAKMFIKQSFLYFVYSKVRGVFKVIWNFTPLNLKLIASIIAAEVVMFITMVLLFANGDALSLLYLLFLAAGTAGIIYFVIKHVIKPYDNEVQSRLTLSLDKAMRAERLKTDLVTNVSHDLKTPLTAILNYSDLLIKEDENNEYAKIIYEKSNKLKLLTEDLFEISKAQSGNIAVNIEKLNISELINQTLAEIDQKTVDFKVNIEKDLHINADGRLMSRVFENLCGNIEKYSLKGTRAYIDAFEKDGKTNIIFKNIANYEMNFNAPDMTERFSRGETSRSTDGNGLGLAIAQSYTEASGGALAISVDGDLFKVSIIF